MYVQFGNADAIAPYRDENEVLQFRDHPGQHVTTVSITDGANLSEAFNTVIIQMDGHIKKGAKPAWIESDSPGLLALLEEHYGLPSAQNNRPDNWGEDTGANLSIYSNPEPAPAPPAEPDDDQE